MKFSRVMVKIGIITFIIVVLVALVINLLFYLSGCLLVTGDRTLVWYHQNGSRFLDAGTRVWRT